MLGVAKNSIKGLVKNSLFSNIDVRESRLTGQDKAIKKLLDGNVFTVKQLLRKKNFQSCLKIIGT